MESLIAAKALVPHDAQAQFSATAESLRDELDRIEARFRSDDVIAGMRDARDTLRSFRNAVSPEQWLELSAETVMTHPIADLMLQCPLTRRSNEKPRGYAGDAELLDLIYGIGENLDTPHPATVAGQIHYFVVHSTACWAVRRRRLFIAERITEEGARADAEVSILSVACGHLREAELLDAQTLTRIRDFYALDQDKDSLAEVVERYSDRMPIHTIEKPVRAILRRSVSLKDLDYIYSAGLFDYLVPPVAMRLIERLFEMLKPGGRLMVANFTPVQEDVGYMETFMDWRLIYRTENELRGLFSNLPREEVASLQTFEDERGAIVYATAEKRV